MPAPRKLRALVVSKERFGESAALFRLKPEAACRYRAGQFLHLALDAYDPSFNWPESRVFSIASLPGGDYLEILVSQKGLFTRRMINELEEGDEVWLKLPFGDFNFDHAVGRDAVLIAGGTGISPFIPFLESLAVKKAAVSSLSLYYGIRDPGLLIYGELLRKLEQSVENFHLHLYVESGTVGLFPAHHTGMLDVAKIAGESRNLPGPVFFISGPKAMIQAFSRELQQNGTPSSKIFFDRWE